MPQWQLREFEDRHAKRFDDQRMIQFWLRGGRQ
jgi:hypothetical protein